MSPAPKKRKPRGPRVFTIAAGVPFVDALAAGIARDTGDDGLALARVTVLVPTRRARRSLAEAFLRGSGGRPLLLPRMIALGDLDEDEALFSGGLDGDGGGPADALAAAPALSGLRRRLLLARLVLAKPDVPGVEQAVNLAAELARLLDQVHTERLDFGGLEALAPGDFSEHWQKTLEFLNVLTEEWPKILAEEEALDAADRRNRVFDAQARAWEENPPADPVIAAGSTGSIPATADLLAVVAGLPKGAVVLPGLDGDATDGAWQALDEHHPQFLMARLLRRLGVTRADVRPWRATGFDSRPSPRARLVGRSLTPAGAEEPKALSKSALDAALSGIRRIDCPGPAEEAAAIALVMRRTLETPGKRAALVTPDRALARRVAAALGRWGLAVDDSAGVPLTGTPAGAFLLLTARMVADGLAPVPLLAALKHPLASGGMETPRFRSLVRSLEVRVLRGPRPAPGIPGLRAAIDADETLAKREHRARKRDLHGLLDDLEGRVRPFADLLADEPRPLADVVEAHGAAAEALAADDTRDGAARLWAGDAGEQAAGFVAELIASARAGINVTAADYPALLDTLMRGVAVRPRYGRHPRLHIWGLLEARLQQADVMILGGLNEGTWPPEAKASPWMSRPMLKAFGLPAPERRLGLTAHDFAQALAAPDVVLTRATRVDGTPQVPARWLLRLDNALERLGRKDALAAAEPWLDWAAALDRPKKTRPVPPPAPAPPVQARPRKLSVTRVETLIRDPYAIYARYVLDLEPLDPIDAEPGAADRGTIVHAALERFHERFRGALPDAAERKLLEIGRDVFGAALARPGVHAFWWPRFERIAHWYVANERDRRDRGFRVLANEADGRMTIDGPAGEFTLTARADRIDRLAGVGLAVIDYKTGSVPSWPQVKVQFAPQLPLEAVIIGAGGFPAVKSKKDAEPEKVAQFVYLHLTGGREPGEEKVLADGIADIVAETAAGVGKLVDDYDKPGTAYLSRVRPLRADIVGDYDHLARVREWHGPQGDGE
ncbi:MAG: double-strand break repair protein AddB [Rhodospirillales bacterium]